MILRLSLAYRRGKLKILDKENIVGAFVNKNTSNNLKHVYQQQQKINNCVAIPRQQSKKQKQNFDGQLPTQNRSVKLSNEDLIRLVLNFKT
jgi:hypothetical protein